MKKTKYIKLYEEFDLDQFLANPEEHFGNSTEGEIEEGDWVESYRGIGMLLKKDEEFGTVELDGSQGKVVKVPLFALKKAKRPEQRAARDTQAKLAELATSLSEYVNALHTDDESDFLNNPESVLNYIESEVLLDIISWTKQDPDTGLYPEYTTVVSSIALLLDLVRNTDPSLDERVHNVLEKLYEMSR